MAKGIISNENGELSQKRLIPLLVSVVLSIVLLVQACGVHTLPVEAYLYYALGIAISYQPKLIHDIFKIKNGGNGDNK